MSAELPSQPRSDSRLLSLDAYRGFVVAAMIFVNYVAELPRMPAWLLHADERPDTYTLPDLVFPGFLFIVGVAVPLSLRATLEGRVPLWRCLLHIGARTVGLLVAGVALEFNETLVAANTGVSRLHWLLLFYLGMLLLWQRDGQRAAARTTLTNRLRRAAGFLLVACLLLAFRGPARQSGGYEWIHHEWWGILGIIGWGYLVCSLLYLAVGGHDLPLAGAVSVMIAFYVGARHGRLDFLGRSINDFLDVGSAFGSVAANVTVGALVGNRFVRDESPRARLRFLLGLGAVCYLSGALLRPLHGYSKNGATESYTLAMCGIHCVLFAIFYVVVDVARARRGIGWLTGIGQNALLAYLLPDLWLHLLELLQVDTTWRRLAWPCFDAGLGAQLLDAALVTSAMLGLCLLLSRAGLRLRF